MEVNIHEYALHQCKEAIERADIVRSHADTLEKRGITVDQFLSPSMDKDLKKIKYYLRINKTIKQNFLQFQLFKFDQPITFSEHGYIGLGHQWDKLLSDNIKSVIASEPSVSDDSDSWPIDFGGESDEFSDTPSEPNEVAKELIKILETECKFKFLESKFALFGYMRDRTTEGKKIPKLCLWQGEADAIAYSATLDKYVIVDFKVVDNLLDYWKKKTDLCGKHLHQCLVYARLLQLHMKLDYLPPSLIVVIDRFNGRQGFGPFFEDYPEECKDKLEEYEWFEEQPPKLPLKMAKTDNLFCDRVGDKIGAGGKFVSSDAQLNKIFNEKATVRDLLKALGYADSRLKIVKHLDE